VTQLTGESHRIGRGKRGAPRRQDAKQTFIVHGKTRGEGVNRRAGETARRRPLARRSHRIHWDSVDSISTEPIQFIFIIFWIKFSAVSQSLNTFETRNKLRQ